MSCCFLASGANLLPTWCSATLEEGSFSKGFRSKLQYDCTQTYPMSAPKPFLSVVFGPNNFKKKGENRTLRIQGMSAEVDICRHTLDSQSPVLPLLFEVVGAEDDGQERLWGTHGVSLCAVIL